MKTDVYADLIPPGERPVPPFARYKRGDNGEEILVSEISPQAVIEYTTAVSTHRKSVAEFDADAADRLRSLFRRYGIATDTPTLEDWQALAVRQAIRHGEPGFVISESPDVTAAARSTRHDEHIARDRYMHNFLEEHPSATMAQAAKSLADHDTKLRSDADKFGGRHRRDLSEWQHRFGINIPSAPSLRSQFSDRMAARRRNSDKPDPTTASRMALSVLHIQKVVGYLMVAASKITSAIYE
jgi:hypothetical protein